MVVATTHTQARYALPQIVARFKAAFPRVHLVLHQGSPAEIVAMLQSGEADVGIATEGLERSRSFVTFPFYRVASRRRRARRPPLAAGRTTAH